MKSPRQVEQHRAARADEARQALRAAAAGDQPELDLRLAELRVVGADPDVAAHRELEAAAEAVAVDRRDERRARRVHPVAERLDPARRAASSPARLAQRRELLDVRAGDERALAARRAGRSRATSSSPSSRSSSASSSSRSAAESAFIGGLSIVTTATAPSCSVVTNVPTEAPRFRRTSDEPDENRSRSAVLRNLPTAVFGISSTNSNRSGSHHFAKLGARNSRSSSAVAVCALAQHDDRERPLLPLLVGDRDHRRLGDGGMRPSARSRASTDEIHSPPDLITSFERSLIWMKPRGWIETMSPVLNQPSSVQRSACSGVS